MNVTKRGQHHEQPWTDMQIDQARERVDSFSVPDRTASTTPREF